MLLCVGFIVLCSAIGALSLGKLQSVANKALDGVAEIYSMRIALGILCADYAFVAKRMAEKA